MPHRQRRVDDEVVAGRLEPEHRAQEQQRRARRPGLRAAGGRVLHRVLRQLPRVAAERLRQAAVEELGGVEDAGGDARRLLLEAVAAQAPGDEGAVEGPHRADVVADRVVARLAHGQRPHAPARVHRRRHEVPGHGLGLRLVDDAAPEQVAVVGGEGVDLAAVGLEGEREVLPVRDPEVAVEAALEVRRLLLELVGERRVVPDLARQPGAAHLGVVGVALQLAGGAREAGQAAVAVRDRVPRVLPALVLEARLLVAPLVGDVAVALQVGVVVDPGQRRARLLLERPHELRVAGPALVLVEQHHVERRRVDGAVVGRVRPLLEGGHLAEAQLVQDAAGVLVAEVVAARPLPQAERDERRPRELGRERQRLQAGEDAVAAEHRHEPGQPGRRQVVAGQRRPARSAAPPGRRGCAGTSA